MHHDRHIPGTVVATTSLAHITGRKLPTAVGPLFVLAARISVLVGTKNTTVTVRPEFGVTRCRQMEDVCGRLLAVVELSPSHYRLSSVNRSSTSLVRSGCSPKFCREKVRHSERERW